MSGDWLLASRFLHYDKDCCGMSVQNRGSYSFQARIFIARALSGGSSTYLWSLHVTFS